MEYFMKVDSTKLRTLRETRGWSQEHLASVAGISVRTLQRMEADGSASAESRMAVAAALQLDAAALCASPPEPEPAASAARPSRPRKDARQGWRLHLGLYLLVCTGLLLVNLLTRGTPGWSLWPALGWGIAVLLHGTRVHAFRRRRAPSIGD